MSLPSYSPGDVLTADDCNTWFMPQFVSKPSATTRTNNTIADDTDLIVPVAASAVYWAQFFLWYDGKDLAGNPASPGGLRVNFAAPASSLWNFQGVGQDITQHEQSDSAFNSGDSPQLWYTDSNNNAATYSGILVTSTTAGNFGLRWAQANTSSTATSVHARSCMIVQRVG